MLGPMNLNKGLWLGTSSPVGKAQMMFSGHAASVKLPSKYLCFCPETGAAALSLGQRSFIFTVSKLQQILLTGHVVTVKVTALRRTSILSPSRVWRMLLKRSGENVRGEKAAECCGPLSSRQGRAVALQGLSAAPIICLRPELD